MVITNVADLAAALRSARVAKGMTQAQLAQLIGVTRQWVASVEKGASTARLGLVLTALTCVDVTLVAERDASGELVDELFGGGS